MIKNYVYKFKNNTSDNVKKLLFINVYSIISSEIKLQKIVNLNCDILFDRNIVNIKFNFINNNYSSILNQSLDDIFNFIDNNLDLDKSSTFCKQSIKNFYDSVLILKEKNKLYSCLKKNLIKKKIKVSKI